MNLLNGGPWSSRRRVARGLHVALLGVMAIAGIDGIASADDAPTIGAGAASDTSAPAIAIEPAPAAALPVAAAPAPTMTSASPSERYAEGVAAYERGEFEAASRMFRALVADGHAEPVILLAMGDAAYRQDHMVEAVYALEWARRLAPTDRDVVSNLEQARARLVRDELPSGGSEATLKFREFLRMIPSLWTALTFVALWIVGWGIVALRQRGRCASLGPVAAAAILLAIPFAAHVAFRVQDADATEQGIVQRLEQDVRSGPGEGYATLFTLHAGTVIVIGEERAGWRRIALPQGSEGWMPSSALAIFGRVETLAAR